MASNKSASSAPDQDTIPTNTETTTDVAIPGIPEGLLAVINSTDDTAAIMDAFEASGVQVSRGEEISGGFITVRDDKKDEFLSQHKGQPVLVAYWTFHEGDFGEYVMVRIVTRTGKYLISDGSTGICKQLRTVTDKRLADGIDGVVPTAGLLVVQGFRESGNYYYDDRTKEAIPNNKLDSVPAQFRKPGKPIWYFAF